MANETAQFWIESVSQNRETGDIVAWVAMAGGKKAHHADLVAKS
jgi:hypothetical protein